MDYENENKQEQLAPVEEKKPMTALTAVSAKKQAPRLNATPSELPALPDEAPAPKTPDPDERVAVVDVQFRPGSKIYFFDPGPLSLKNGDHVILDTARGAEYGYCLSANHRVAYRELVQPLRRVLRIATAIDERIKEENERREKDAYAFCLRRIEDLGLDMQLVSTECAFDGSKLLFFFTADARVDFRELVKILASNYHTRIELRQIGVRDKAKMLGGLGICGRPFCCASFLEDFQPVSIKMAKTQNLSLNPTKISGTCGRLMCCLKYEQEAYEDLIRTSPKAESFVDTPDGRGTVTGVNLMKQSVSVRMEKDEDEVRSYRNSDICVLRSGKAKKNDPPIPEDLAPISGRRDGELLRERRPFLDHRLTVDPEESAGEPEEPTEPAPEQPEDRPARRNNRRDRKPAQAEARQPEKPEKPEKADRPEQPRTPQKPAPEKKQEPEKKPAAEAGNGARRRRGGKGERTQEQPQQKAERSEKQEKPEPRPEQQQQKSSRQQRRRQQQGKAEPRLPQPEQSRRPAPEKRPEEQPAPKPEGKKNNKRRYYHNRKPKG